MDLARVATTAAWVVGGIVVYEIVRSAVVARLSRRLDRLGRRYVEGRRIQLDRYKFAGRAYVKHEVINDPTLVAAIDAAAKEQNRPVAAVRDEVDRWLDEIIPAFNTLAFFRFGFALAKMFLTFVFEPIVDQRSLERAQTKIPEGAAVVYVFNHRSNADFIFASYALASSIAISYAVGEWARIWPLDSLFRRFGAYFVRRGFRNPLYHLTLARYVQLIVRRGVTQGVFPEGGLTRDGGLRDPKLGILEYIAQLKADPSFRGDVVFIPVGINYDRVLEDHSLIAEAKGGAALGKDSLASRLATLGAIARRAPQTLIVNAYRALAGRTGRYGYAAVVFGDPVSLGSWLAASHDDVFALPAEARRERIRNFANLLMSEIGRLVPVTPATAVAETLARDGRDELSAGELRVKLEQRLAEWRAAGRRIARGREFAPIEAGWARLAADASDRRAELFEEERRMVAGEESELMLRLGLDFLARRRAIRLSGRGDAMRVAVADPDVLLFYARSLDKTLTLGAAAGPATSAPARAAAAAR